MKCECGMEWSADKYGENCPMCNQRPASPSLLGVRCAPDLKAMSRELTDAFIGYQWRLENPYPVLYDKDAAEREYIHDHIFHNKVQQLTCGVMQIVQKHL